uniref:Uncharacterized protein n=1 Tax=Globodera rostochiensis TaxID=31243 RepID=A0A914GYA5_GLORO
MIKKIQDKFLPRCRLKMLADKVLISHHFAHRWHKWKRVRIKSSFIWNFFCASVLLCRAVPKKVQENPHEMTAVAAVMLETCMTAATTSKRTTTAGGTRTEKSSRAVGNAPFVHFEIGTSTRKPRLNPSVVQQQTLVQKLAVEVEKAQQKKQRNSAEMVVRNSPECFSPCTSSMTNSPKPTRAPSVNGLSQKQSKSLIRRRPISFRDALVVRKFKPRTSPRGRKKIGCLRKSREMTDVFKRPALPLVPTNAKRQHFSDDVSLIPLGDSPRTEDQRMSGLQSPIMLLTGHEGEIHAAQFSPDGTCIASVGFDQRIFFWNVYGECDNFSTISGHKGAIMDVHFSTDASFLFTCSTDKTVRVWDMESGQCLRRFRTHTEFVNSCHPARRGPSLICSGCDGGKILIHDVRRRGPVATFENVNGYQVTALTFNDTAEQIISGGIDNVLKIWDIRRLGLLYVMPGHTDTVTGLTRIWDIRPYASSQRCVKTLTGHQHNFEKNLLRCAWSPDGHRVSCGSSDRFVYIWDVGSRNIAYKLPGHQGSVNAVDFHPKEPIVLSAGSDKRIFLGELAH